MSKKIPKRRSERFKTVKVTTKTVQHHCTAECFQDDLEFVRPKLRKLSLGHIYRDADGRFFQDWGDDEFLEVTGITFLARGSGLSLMFHPKHELQIHSPGGKTTAVTTAEREVRTDAGFHAVETAKKLKRKQMNLRQSQDFFRVKAAEIIPRAPKRSKPTKGIGRGAPKQPRSAMGREIVRLVKDGKTKREILSLTIDFAKKNTLPIAGPHLRNIKKQIRFWLEKVDR